MVRGKLLNPPNKQHSSRQGTTKPINSRPTKANIGSLPVIVEEPSVVPSKQSAIRHQALREAPHINLYWEDMCQPSHPTPALVHGELSLLPQQTDDTGSNPAVIDRHRQCHNREIKAAFRSQTSAFGLWFQCVLNSTARNKIGPTIQSLLPARSYKDFRQGGW